MSTWQKAGIFAINYGGVVLVLDKIKKLINELKDANIALQKECARQSQCRGTKENPHNHYDTIAVMGKLIEINQEDIADLHILYSKIQELVANAQQADMDLEDLIRKTLDSENYENWLLSNGGAMTSEEVVKKENEVANDIWNSTKGINLSSGKMGMVTCQSTQWEPINGEYSGSDGCVSTTIAAMFRLNHGAVGKAKDLVVSKADGSYPTAGKNGYSYKIVGSEVQDNIRAKNGSGIQQDIALNAIKEELAQGNVCGVKLAKGTDYGHTVVCSGVVPGVSLKNATWGELLFNDVGRGAESNRKAKTMLEMNYPGVEYTAPNDGDCYVLIDTTK